MKPLWTPSPERVAETNLESFRQAVNEKFALNLSAYDDLHAWSIRELKAFWQFYATYSQLRFHSPAKTILSDDPMPYTRWF